MQSVNSGSAQAFGERHAPMLLGIIGGLIAATALIFYWQPTGPTKHELAVQKILLQNLRQGAARLSSEPLYPPLTDSWLAVVARYKACDLNTRELKKGAGGADTARYEGPVAAWHLQITGPSARLLSCTLTLPRDVFVRPTSYSIRGDNMVLTLAVLGRAGTSLAGHPYNVSGDTP